MKIVEINFDGGYDYYRKEASYGYVVRWDKTKIRAGKVVAGHGRTQDPRFTVHISEYFALLKAIKRFKKEVADWKEYEFNIYGDSKLVIEHINRRWGVEKSNSGKTFYGWNPHKGNPHLRAMLEAILRELQGLEFNASWIRRDRNKEADKLTRKKISTEKK